jgi:holo-[acyl-carrier protein] synthase
VITLPVHLMAVADLPPPGDWATTFTAAELAYCTGLRHTADHLAARAAAKRAVLAALAAADPGSWHEVEILREPHRAPVVVLHGELDEARRAAGLPVPRVSLTHAAGHAAAIACLPGARQCG